MGLQINADLETIHGPTQEAYIKIDSIRLNQVMGEVKFTTSAWLTKEYADRFKRVYFDEPGKNAKGILPSKVVYFENDDSDGEDIEFSNFYIKRLVVEKEVETPIYEEKEKQEELPYITFDSEGNEITKYRTSISKVKEQVGTKKEIKELIDYSISTNIFGFCSGELKKDLSELFGKENIKDN